MRYAGTHLAGTVAAAAVTALVLAPSALAEPGPASVATATPSVIAADWHHGHGPWPEGLMRFAGFLAKLRPA